MYSPRKFVKFSENAAARIQIMNKCIKLNISSKFHENEVFLDFFENNFDKTFFKLKIYRYISEIVKKCF